MTVTEKTAPSQTETISFELELPHAPRKVWRALTTPELLSEWLLPIAELELTPGANFTFTTQPQPGWDGLVHGRMLEIEPEKKLSYAWIAGDIDTVATFRLEPTTTGTRLLIEHSGFKASQKRNFSGARYGWNMMTGKLADVLAKMPS